MNDSLDLQSACGHLKLLLPAKQVSVDETGCCKRAETDAAVAHVSLHELLPDRSIRLAAYVFRRSRNDLRNISEEIRK